MAVCNSGICMCLGVCTVLVLLDGVCYVAACVGLLSASLPNLFDVKCGLLHWRSHEKGWVL